MNRGLVAVFVLLCMLALSIVQVVEAIEWTDPIVIESAGDVGSLCSIAVDAYLVPHVIYYDATLNEMKHAWKDGDVWDIETVASSVSAYPMRMVLDSSGNPRILYYRGGDLVYSWKQDDVWQMETVATDASAGGMNGFTFDQGGWPHITYLRGYVLVHAWKSASGWATEDVVTTVQVYSSSLAIDPTGQILVAYARRYGTLSFATKSLGGIWSWTDLCPGASAPLCLVFNNDGYPTILHSVSGTLKLVQRTASGWGSPETIGTFGSWYTSMGTLVYDAWNNPWTIYRSEAYDVTVAFKNITEGIWYRQHPDLSSQTGYYAGICVDSNVYVHIVYYASINSELRYMKTTAPIIPEFTPIITVAVIIAMTICVCFLIPKVKRRVHAKS